MYIDLQVECRLNNGLHYRHWKSFLEYEKTFSLHNVWRRGWQIASLDVIRRSSRSSVSEGHFTCLSMSVSCSLGTVETSTNVAQQWNPSVFVVGTRCSQQLSWIALVKERPKMQKWPWITLVQQRHMCHGAKNIFGMSGYSKVYTVRNLLWSWAALNFVS
jgi:hypothetical protein